MKLIPPTLVRDVINIIADARQNTICNGVVHNTLIQLQQLADAPVPEKKETPDE